MITDKYTGGYWIVIVRALWTNRKHDAMMWDAIIENNVFYSLIHGLNNLCHLHAETNEKLVLSSMSIGACEIALLRTPVTIETHRRIIDDTQLDTLLKVIIDEKLPMSRINVLLSSLVVCDAINLHISIGGISNSAP